MYKLKLLLLGIGTLFLLWIISWFGLFNFISGNSGPSTKTDETLSISPSSSEVKPETKYIYLKIDFGDGKNYEGKILTDSKITAYEALIKFANENSLKVETTKYDFGIFVKSINGYESTAQKSWIYFVNEKSGDVAADKYEINPNDLVEWKYLSPTE